MKNVTISMDEDTAAWARIEAAKAGKSLSRFVGDVIASKMERQSSQSEILKKIMSYPKLDLTDESGNAPTRNELYDDQILRGYERSDLRPRQEIGAKRENGGGLVEQTGRK